MWRLFLASLICVSTFRLAEAVEQKFPYKAAVISEKVEVRCGPGSNFYVTSYLQPNDQVTVHRHDHGGWFMIAPPKGSVSWIDASLVKRAGSDRGVINVSPKDGRPARAIVRIGSAISDDHAYYGRELSNGDEVTILGEKTLATARGPVAMLKIVPPPQEFRWVKGEFLVPVDETVRQQIAQDPYQVPAEHRPSFVAQKKETQIAQQKQSEQEQAAKQRVYDELDRIDRQYADMMQQEPVHWNLDGLEAEYRKLEGTADSSISALVQKRLDVIGRRREILSHYRNFVQVSAETARRDQELVAMQLGFQNADPAAAQIIEGPGDSMASAQPGQTIDSSVAPRLNGAGIIQQIASFPGAPQYALMAPDGRLLAYLEVAEGARIRDWIGKPSGIIGNRQFDPQLGSDVIRVQRVVPVQLVP